MGTIDGTGDGNGDGARPHWGREHPHPLQALTIHPCAARQLQYVNRCNNNNDNNNDDDNTDGNEHDVHHHHPNTA